MAVKVARILEQIVPHKIPEDLGQLLDKLGYVHAESFFEDWIPDIHFIVHVKDYGSRGVRDICNIVDFVASTNNFLFSGYDVPRFAIPQDIDRIGEILNEKPSRRRLRNIGDTASLILLALGTGSLAMGVSSGIPEFHPGQYFVIGGGVLSVAGGIAKGAVSLLERDLYQAVQNMSENRANYLYGEKALDRLNAELRYRQIQSGEITLEAYLNPKPSSEIQL